MKRPTHVMVAYSDGEKLIGERWITLEEFAKLFTYGESYDKAAVRGESEPNYEIRVRSDVAGRSPK